MRENRPYSCVSSEGWRVQWEIKPTEAKVRSLVAWIARRKETESLKPIDRIIPGMTASHWAVTKVNADVASKVSGPRGRACNCKAKAAWVVATAVHTPNAPLALLAYVDSNFE